MQKIVKKSLFISIISFLSCTIDSQQQGLGCEATNIMAGVVAAGVAYRSLYSLTCFAGAPDNVAYSISCARQYKRAPEEFGLDILYKGFYPALVAGTLTAVAARSGSLPQLSMNDVIKPAAWGFGSLFAASMPFVFYSGKYQWEEARLLQEQSIAKKEFNTLSHLKRINSKRHEENKWAAAKEKCEQAEKDYADNDSSYKAKRNSAINWERYVIGYAQNALVVGLPLYVLYQRYKQS